MLRSDRVAGSTLLNVTGDVASGWRVYSDAETLPGCVATDVNRFGRRPTPGPSRLDGLLDASASLSEIDTVV